MADYKKPDYWQQKAHKEGYPARSVYKLMEIDDKFALFKHSGRSGNFRVLDIGAAPGSWSLYVLRKFSGKGFLAAADLSPLSCDLSCKSESDRNIFDNDNFFFIQGDITTDKVREVLLSKGPYSVIISDAAPSTTGNNMVDSARSMELAEAVIDYAENALVPGGSLVFKVFQGSGTDTLLKRMRMLFKTVKTFKPKACRSESVETYIIGLFNLKTGNISA
jgi:23S rRNA (uridine2552-2'-O)-methyltransferase